MTLNDEDESRLAAYRHTPLDYIKNELGQTLWGSKTQGQLQILHYYELAIRQQEELHQFENGEIAESDLEYYVPGESIQNWISIDAGHSSGKTFTLAAIVNHFFDCMSGSITYCFAPAWDQVNDLLFKEIRTQRAGHDLPGEVLERTPRINYRSDHFVVGKATTYQRRSDRLERIHGQHHRHLLFVVDESEAVEKYVFDSIEAMASGGDVSIVLIARNPRTSVCEAHRLRSAPHVIDLRISDLEHPNVVEGRNIIPGSVRREYIESMLRHCVKVDSHNEETYTFELPWLPGDIWQPGEEFLWRVLGIATDHLHENTFCSYADYDGAVTRGRENTFEITEDWAFIGVDAARFGTDYGTVYIRSGQWLWRSFHKRSTNSYDFYGHIRQKMVELLKQGVTKFDVRVDAGGGFGAGLVDLLANDLEINKHTDEFAALTEFRVVEVNFNGTPDEGKRFYDLSTEMLYHLGATMQALKLRQPTVELRQDVCERTYGPGTKKGFYVKILQGKEAFRKDFSRSPDDGDGAMLANAPAHLFRKAVLAGWA